MNPRGRQPDHSDWKPLAVPKGYGDKYDEIEWDLPKITLREGFRATTDGTNHPFRLVKIEELPYCLRCGGEVKFFPTPDIEDHPDLFGCEKCDLISAEEDGEIEWKTMK